ncbi:ABC1 kinase family protein [Aquirhabdus sp.]|uniref:ABC1 kinase family protein n=1 Tax=Aquirhabdus sp. TaxID=2824160 RepID=UPI00396CE5F0
MSDASNPNTRDKHKQHHTLDKLKTSAFERRMSLAKASLRAGSRWASVNAGTMFSSDADKERKRKKVMSEQAQYLVQEMGKLKGSIVKIGQMMALYGEHFLPPEVTEALHTLNNDTMALSWSAIEQQLKLELGSKLDELNVDQEPLGTASLAQVHRAVRKSDGLEIVLKVQYPGVAAAIDSDLGLFRNMLKLTRMVPQTREFEEWFSEVSEMMHREVNYQMEAATTERFYERLKDDPRYIVPQIIHEYCTDGVLCMTFERGVPINSAVMLSLPQSRRDKLGAASIEIAVREMFEWGEMQTDPNFGNYLVRLGNGKDIPDKTILLDFGAIRGFDSNLLKVARSLIIAGYNHNKAQMIAAMQGYIFFDQMPTEVKPGMADVFLMATEPFTSPQVNPDAPADVFDAEGKYIWKQSLLHSRVMKLAGNSMTSRYFSIPPKEFMFISRKFIGAYTFMTVIDARTDVRSMVSKFL